VVDGHLDEACWQKAVRIDFGDAFGNPATYRTYGLLAWDEQNLHVAFVNEDPNPTGLTVNHTGKDADFIWDDEVMELFFREEAAAAGDYYQFIINAAGSVWDAHWIKDTHNPTQWDSGCTAQTAVTPDGWVLEASLPFRSLGLASVAGRTITANFYRSRNNRDISGATRSCWSPNLSAGYNVPERFGYLTFRN
jgi:hypothetical protein